MKTPHIAAALTSVAFIASTVPAVAATTTVPAVQRTTDQGKLIRTVNVKTLCYTFGTKRMRCNRSGSAPSGGSMAYYRVRTEKLVGYTSHPLFRAKRTSCKKISLTFFSAPGVDRTRVRIVTASGTKRVATRGSRKATIRAFVGRKPFTVSVRMEHNGLYPVYFTGFGRCGSRSGA